MRILLRWYYLRGVRFCSGGTSQTGALVQANYRGFLSSGNGAGVSLPFYQSFAEGRPAVIDRRRVDLKGIIFRHVGGVVTFARCAVSLMAEESALLGGGRWGLLLIRLLCDVDTYVR